MSRYRKTMAEALQEVSVSIDEARMKDIYTMDQEGQSAAEIAKKLKLPVGTVKKILGEKLEEKIRPFMLSYSKGGTHAGFEDADSLPELQNKAQKLRAKGFTIDKMGRNMAMKFAKEDRELREFSDAMLDRLAREFAPLKDKSISVQQANKLRMIFNKIPDRALDALRRKKIPFLSGLALSRMVQKGMPVKEELEERTYDPIQFGPDKVAKAMAIAVKSDGQYSKAVKPEPNPDTGEVPLTIGLANKLLKDKEMKKEDVQEADLTKPQIKKVHKMADELPKKDFKDRYCKEKGDAVRYATATNIVKKKLGIEDKNMKNEEMRLRVEAIAGLKKKAEKSGMPYSILKKVYDRGMAAWKGGHRPGASQHQWAFARVNSFVTKSSGTWGGADKDLAAKVRASK